jgi:hypothetical protein
MPCFSRKAAAQVRARANHAVCHRMCGTQNVSYVLAAQSALSTAVSVTPAMPRTRELVTQPIGTVLFRQSGSILR